MQTVYRSGLRRLIRTKQREAARRLCSSEVLASQSLGSGEDIEVAEGMKKGGAFDLVWVPDSEHNGVAALMAAVDEAYSEPLHRLPRSAASEEGYNTIRLYSARFNKAIELGPRYLKSMRIDWDSPGREEALFYLGLHACRTYMGEIGRPVMARLARILYGPRGVGKSAVLQAVCIAAYVAAKGDMAVGYYAMFPFVGLQDQRPVRRATYDNGFPLSPAQMIGELLIANGLGEGGHRGILQAETRGSLLRPGTKWAAWNTESFRIALGRVAMPKPAFMVVDEIQDLFRHVPVAVPGLWDNEKTQVNNVANTVFEVLTSAFRQNTTRPWLGLTIAGSSPIILDALCRGEFRSEYCKEKYGQYINLPRVHPHMIVRLDLKPLASIGDVKRFLNVARPGVLEQLSTAEGGDTSTDMEAATHSVLNHIALGSKGVHRHVLDFAASLMNGKAPTERSTAKMMTADSKEWEVFEAALTTHYVREGLVDIRGVDIVLDQQLMGVSWASLQRSLRLMVEYDVMKDAAEKVLEKWNLSEEARMEYFKLWEEVGLLAVGRSVHFATHADLVTGVSKLFSDSVDLRLPATMMEPLGDYAAYWGNMLAASALAHEHNFADAVAEHLVVSGDECAAEQWKTALQSALSSTSGGASRGRLFMKQPPQKGTSATSSGFLGGELEKHSMQVEPGETVPAWSLPPHWSVPNPYNGIDSVHPVGDYVVCVQVKLSKEGATTTLTHEGIGKGFARALSSGGIDPDKAVLVLVTTHSLSAKSAHTIVNACREEYETLTGTDISAGMAVMMLGREQMAPLWHPIVQNVASVLQLKTYLGTALGEDGGNNEGGSASSGWSRDAAGNNLQRRIILPAFAPILRPTVMLQSEIQEAKARKEREEQEKLEQQERERKKKLEQQERERKKKLEQQERERKKQLEQQEREEQAQREREEVWRRIGRENARHLLHMATYRLSPGVQAQVRDSGLTIEDVGSDAWVQLVESLEPAPNEFAWKATLQEIDKAVEKWKTSKWARAEQGPE